MKWYGKYGRKASWIVIKYGQYGRTQGNPYLFTFQLTFLPYFSYLFTFQFTFLPYFPNLSTWKDIENAEENCEMILKIWKKIGKRYKKYRRKISWIVKRYGKYGRKVSWMVIRFGKYGRKIPHFQYLFTIQLGFLPYFDESSKCCDIRHGLFNYLCLLCFIFSLISPFFFMFSLFSVSNFYFTSQYLELPRKDMENMEEKSVEWW
jgi:hypothetical protein